MSFVNNPNFSPFGTPATRTGLGGLMATSYRRQDSVSLPHNEDPDDCEALGTSHQPADYHSNQSQVARSGRDADILVDVFDDDTTIPLLAQDYEDDLVDAQGPDRVHSSLTNASVEFSKTSSQRSSAVCSPDPSRRHSTMADPPHKRVASAHSSVLHATVYGLVNSVVTIPLMLSFGAIIFQDPVFHPILGQTARLVFLSGALHQLVFVASSSLPFAVGQVQDVGLIFLSAMASNIVTRGTADGLPFATIVATTLWAITISTALTGCLIVLTGYLKLAQLVQYVPLPVVGGYLGYVGYFCTASGLSLATGVMISSPASWLGLITMDALLKILPVLSSWLLMYLVNRYIPHPLALPAVLCFVPTTLYMGLAALGCTLQDAQNAGWVFKLAADSSIPCWKIYDLYNWHDLMHGVAWNYLPQQAGLLVALFFVVAFGSSMDVAAIQQDYAHKMDYNKELVTVGLSNLVTGVAGCGFTGSYIFSQTKFSMAMGVCSRINGVIITCMELTLWALPVSVIQYLPNYFYGALMLWIGIDILKDWLVLSYNKVRSSEFILLWLSFLLIWMFGLEMGIAAGCVLSCMNFAYAYAKGHVYTFAVLPSRSGSMRTLEERTLLEIMAKRITSVVLTGYIFFGSSVKISDKVVQVADVLMAGDEAVQEGALMSSMKVIDLQVSNLIHLNTSLKKLSNNVEHKARAAFLSAPRFMLLDFRRVTGIDATAARTFSTLSRQLSSMGIELIITHLPAYKSDSIKKLLQAHGVIGRDGIDISSGACVLPGACRSFPTTEDGVMYCEHQLLDYARQEGLLPPATQHMTLEQLLAAHINVNHMMAPQNIHTHQIAVDLAPFLDTRLYRAGDVLFNLEDPADDVAFILSGEVVMQMWYSGVRLRQPFHTDNKKGFQRECKKRVIQVGAGGMLGEMDFILQRPRSYKAVAQKDSRVALLCRNKVQRMAVEAPHLLNIIQSICLRAACMSLSHTFGVLENADLET